MIRVIGRRNVRRNESALSMEAAMMQARYPPEQLRQLDQARYCQKTDAINRRVNAVYFYGRGVST